MITDVLQFLYDGIEDQLPEGWVLASEQTALANSKILEIILLSSQFSFDEMTEIWLRGTIGFVFYDRIMDSIDNQLDAVEDVIRWLETLTLEEFVIGDDTGTLAVMETPSIISDGSIDYRVITVSVPFNMIVRFDTEE